MVLIFGFQGSNVKRHCLPSQFCCLPLMNTDRLCLLSLYALELNDRNPKNQILLEVPNALLGSFLSQYHNKDTARNCCIYRIPLPVSRTVANMFVEVYTKGVAQ